MQMYARLTFFNHIHINDHGQGPDDNRKVLRLN